MKVQQLDTNGIKTTELQVSDDLFKGAINEKLVSQYVRVHLLRKSLRTKKTKNRGEVAGGGSKPWRQKGTGRARHGSIRSPIWVGGGHTHAILSHGPRRVGMNLKMRQGALISALTQKNNDEAFVFVDNIELKKPKTKEIRLILEKLNLSEAKMLMVTPQKDEVLQKATRNLANVTVRDARLLNAYDILKAGKIVFLGEAVKVMEEVFLKKTKLKNE